MIGSQIDFELESRERSGTIIDKILVNTSNYNKGDTNYTAYLVKTQYNTTYIVKPDQITKITNWVCNVNKN